MKTRRNLRALSLGLMLFAAPAGADQGTIVGPTIGPKTMTEVMGVINAALLAIQSCNSGSSAPANGVAGAPTQFQCWADTSAAPVISFKRYDGASWVTFGTLNTSTHVWTPYRAGAPIVAVATSGSASDLSTGTLPAARLPNPSASALGGVQSKTCSASQWLNDVSTGGVLSCAQPNFTDLAGNASLAQLPAFSGMAAAAAASDTDTVPTNQGAGNLKQTLAAIKTWIKAWIVKADVGLGNVDNTSDTTKWAATKILTNTTYNCGSTGNVCTVRFADITGFGTGVSTALGVNVGSAGAVVVNGGALGTPSSGVATNLTGTAAGLTAGNVTTNANMTGDVTSVGNATTLTNAPVIAKVLTAFAAGAGTVTSSDSILSAFQKVVGNIALKANVANGVHTGVTDLQGAPKFTGIASPSQITANQNDYNPGSVICSTAETLRLTSDASRDITGFAGGATGCQLTVMNVGSNPIVLKDQAGGSSVGNRLAIGGDATIAAQSSYALRYDGTSTRWRPVVSPGAGSGGGGVLSVACAEGAQCSTITTTGTVKTTYARHFMMGGM